MYTYQLPTVNIIVMYGKHVLIKLIIINLDVLENEQIYKETRRVVNFFIWTDSTHPSIRDLAFAHDGQGCRHFFGSYKHRGSSSKYECGQGLLGNYTE